MMKENYRLLLDFRFFIRCQRDSLFNFGKGKEKCFFLEKSFT